MTDQQPDTLAKLAAKAAHEAVSAIYFADSSDYLPALRSITRLLAPDLAAMLDTDEQLAWQTSDDRANGPDEITAQALPAAEPVELALCESQRLVLREGVLYRFVKVGDCETCATLSAASLEAYGAPQAAQRAAQAPAMHFTGAFTGVAGRKLAELQSAGYQVNGYSLMHAETRQRALIDHGGFVGWWHNRDHEQAAQATAGWVPSGAKELLRAGVVCHDLGHVSVSTVQRRLATGWERARELCEQLIQLRLVDGLDTSPHLVAALPQPQPQSTQGGA